VVTLVAQLFRLGVSFTMAALVPRALGPVDYGNYAFLMSTATTLRGVTDSATQQAFFTFSSQESHGGPLTRLYGLVLLGQFLLIFGLIGMSAALGWLDIIWHGQKLDQIVLVTVLEWTLFLTVSLQQLGDSKGRTVQLQFIAAGGSVLVIAGLVALWLVGWLDFYGFVAVNVLGGLITCGLLGHWLFVRHRAIFWQGAIAGREYIRRWWRFARPLLLLQYWLPLVTFAGIYGLQRWYGASEQAFYALSMQWSTFALVFTTSGLWIFWREIAARNAAGEVERTAAIYVQFSSLFVFLALVLAGWLSASSGLLIDIVAGPEFSRAAPVLAMLAFYPVSQTIGQLSSASLKATERTVTYARWSFLLSVPDLLLTWVVLAPTDGLVPGLGLGATGLAAKMALFGLLNVHVFDWVNCRLLGLRFSSLLKRRAIAFVIVIGVAWLMAGTLGPALASVGLPSVAALAISSAAYFAAMAILVWFSPTLAGLTREQISEGLHWLVRRLPVSVRRKNA
jgi:O-antigen/teichoic acid export membrane protein